jgi:hypothetical protein
MRLVLAVSALVLVAGACAQQGSGRGGAIGAPTGPDPTRVGIYVATFRSLAETERWFDPVLLDERICPDVADVRTPQQAPCPERFTEAEQAAILAGLADLPGIRFVDDAEHVQDRIFSGGLQGAGLLTVGGIDGGDERVTVAGRSYCGGLCAHWMTLVVRNRPDGWTVTGTTGPIAIA